MTSQKLDSIRKKSPPNLRESSDYNKEPLAPRCFNCMFMRDENLDFYCSKFMVRTKVYKLCDEWKSNHEGYSIVSSPRLNEATHEIQQKIVDEYEPLLLVSAKKNLKLDPSD